MISLLRSLALAGACGLLAACSSGPDIRSDYDREADFGRYRTFAFMPHLGTDKSGYSSLLTDRLKSATRGQMEMRGYAYNESDPDLLINFNANVREKTEVVSRPPLPYYGYRTGFYGGWPGYPWGSDVLQYSEGTLNIDLVDARRRQLVWEGVSVGPVGEDVLDATPEQVNQGVARIFARYPFRAGVAAPQLPAK